MKLTLAQLIGEIITDTKIICDNCGWSWNKEDGGDDLYMCHKCGHNNTPHALQEVAVPSNIPSDIMYSLNTTKGMSGNHRYHIGTLLQALHRGSTIQDMQPEEKFYLHTVKFNSNVTIFPKVVDDDPEEGYDDDFNIRDVGETDVVIYDNGVEGMNYPEPLPDGCKTANQSPNYSIYTHSRNFKVVKVEELTTGWKGDDYLGDEENQHVRALYSACKLEYVPDVDENSGGADTAWEDDKGNKVTLQDILDMTNNIPIKDYPTEKLAKIVLNWDDNPEEVERIKQVEISKQYPILIMIDATGKIQWILDGNHRAQKALRSKAKTIPAKLIKPSNLDDKAKRILLGTTDENFKDGKKKGKSRPGRVKKSGASCNGSVTDLRKKAKNASGEKAKMYHWCANMKGGKK